MPFDLKKNSLRILESLLTLSHTILNFFLTVFEIIFSYASGSSYGRLLNTPAKIDYQQCEKDAKYTQ